MFLWHLRDIIAKSLPPPTLHSISLIFLNLSAQTEVRIRFSPSLINLLRLPFFHFLQPSSLAPASLSPSSSWLIPASCSLNPPCSVCLPRFSHLTSSSASRHRQSCRGRFCFAPPPRASISLSSSLSIPHYCASPSSKGSGDSCVVPHQLTLNNVLTCTLLLCCTNF